MRNDVLTTAYAILETLVDQFRAALDGIPDDDLNTWKPGAEQHGGGDMNTFAVLGVHTVAAARWRIENQVFDRGYVRDRESEFTATATRAELDAQFATMLEVFGGLIESDEAVDLDALPTTPREDHPDWTRLRWLLTAIEHTALHLGHAQIHRQLWLAERAADQ